MHNTFFLRAIFGVTSCLLLLSAEGHLRAAGPVATPTPHQNTKISLDDIVITGGGSAAADKVTGEIAAPSTNIDGFASISPASEASSLSGILKIRLVQNVNTVRKAFRIVNPPNGDIITSNGNMVYDSLAISTIGSLIAAGGIGGAGIVDAPNLVGASGTHNQLVMNDLFIVYLQYTLDGTNWNTVGARYWYAYGSSNLTSSGTWSGAISAGPSGGAYSTQQQPVFTPAVNTLPMSTF